MNDVEKKYKFELGLCDPRNNSFDHHDGCSKSNTFTMKMASVQLMEKLMICGEVEMFSIEDVEFNHLGHIDDIIMAAIPFAWENSRIRNLYKFACVVSAYDSLGPIAKEMLMTGRDEITLIVAQEAYQEICDDVREKNNPKGYSLLELHKIPLTINQKWKAVRYAANCMMSRIPRDDLNNPTEVIMPEEAVIKDEQGGVVLVKGYNNPYLSSPYFLKQGATAVIFFREHDSLQGRFVYHIFARSAYHVNLSSMWSKLQRKELYPDPKFNKNLWGGNAGAGGSPRQCGSRLQPDLVFQYVQHEVVN